MPEAPSEPYAPAACSLLDLAFLAVLISIALLAAGCGASFLPDSRMTTRGNIRAYEEPMCAAGSSSSISGVSCTSVRAICAFCFSPSLN